MGDGGAVDFEALAAAVGEATRAVVLCSPNDPTGIPVDREALHEFAAGLRPSVSVLVDEALVEFAEPGTSCAALVDELPNLLVLRSFSKGWAMAGLRGGYVLGPAGDEELLAVLSPGQGVASPTLAAIAAALQDPARADRRLGARRARIAAERARLAELLAGTPFTFGPSATHAIWLRGGDGMSAASITDGLAKQRVLVASGAAWDDADHVRVTLRDRAASERLAAALQAL
jgi:histidinol-phosphate aminotransferase